MRRIAGLLIPLLLCSGCLVKETRQTLYLEPDGRLTWTILESDVHSSSQKPAERQTEESGYLAEVEGRSHGAFLALATLGPSRLDAWILRSDRPFTVWTEARYSSLDRVGQAILDRLQVPGQATLWTDAEGTHFELVCRPDLAPDDDDADAKLLLPLADGLDQATIVLTQGRFTRANGFRIQSEGRAAVLVVPDSKELPVDGAAMTFALSWTVAE